jgi:hypothetical protein
VEVHPARVSRSARFLGPADPHSLRPDFPAAIIPQSEIVDRQTLPPVRPIQSSHGGDLPHRFAIGWTILRDGCLRGRWSLFARVELHFRQVGIEYDLLTFVQALADFHELSRSFAESNLAPLQTVVVRDVAELLATLVGDGLGRNGKDLGSPLESNVNLGGHSGQ